MGQVMLGQVDGANLRGPVWASRGRQEGTECDTVAHGDVLDNVLVGQHKEGAKEGVGEGGVVMAQAACRLR